MPETEDDFQLALRRIEADIRASILAGDHDAAVKERAASLGWVAPLSEEEITAMAERYGDGNGAYSSER